MESRVNRLEIEMGKVFTRLEPLEEWIPESRRFQDRMNDFRSDLLARQEEERRHHDAQHQQNSMKLNILTILIAFGTLIITLIGVAVAYNQSHHAKTTPLITHHQPIPQTDAESTLPPTFQEK